MITPPPAARMYRPARWEAKNGRPQIHVNEAVELLDGRVGAGISTVNGRVVDQHVEPAHRRVRLVHHVQHRIDVREVDRDRMGRNSTTPCLGGNLTQLPGIGRRNRHVGARLGERQGNAASDAAAGARDQRPATGKREDVLHD